MRGCWSMRSFMRRKRDEENLMKLEIAPSIYISRRTLLRWAAMSSVAGVSAAVFAQEAKTARGELAPLNRFSRMVQEWFVDQVRAAEEKIKQRLATLKTKEDAEAYVRSVQERVRQSFGPEPERTPLNARVTGIVERDT